MILCEWRDFSTDTETYTLERFEEIMNDEFEAMLVQENENIPSYIWTSNYVVIVKKYQKLIMDVSFEKIPRNPVCE
ncbi:hypothetical protein ACE38V_19270 [Cytobacillus sp. Hz8]|uniref:hypothetical protein n=1 Tax=Cytobacillus sp. Hz8 TaxID=3347168 RepID=UPI0035E0CA35